MPTDAELLHRYAETRSEEAFRELVQRHHTMVYFAALRKLRGDVHRAKEVAQDVFVDLGRKAAALARRPGISGWLYVSACYGAAKAVRAAQRKSAAEEKAARSENVLSVAKGRFETAELSPVVDELLVQLNARDREAVLLRFFEGLTFVEMAAQLELSEDGARLRLNRALEKMRTLLGRRGVVSTSAALSCVLSAQASAAAPEGLAGALAAGALQQLSVGSASAVYIFTMTKSTIAVGSALVLAGAISVIYTVNSNRHDTSRSAASDSAAVVATANKVQAEKTSTLPPAAANSSKKNLNSHQGSSEQPPTATNDTKPELFAGLSRGVIPISALSNIGCSTPRAALESFLWAIARGTDQDIAGLIGLSDDQRKTINAMLETLPPETREKYPDAEHVVALFAAREGTIVPAEGTIEITSETLAAGNEVKYSTHISTSAEQYRATSLVHDNSSEINIRNFPAGWKIVVPDYVINMIAPRLAARSKSRARR
jgi:RNA polymerase sigma factor (sigma-70 family)